MSFAARAAFKRLVFLLAVNRFLSYLSSLSLIFQTCQINLRGAAASSTSVSFLPSSPFPSSFFSLAVFLSSRNPMLTTSLMLSAVYLIPV